MAEPRPISAAQLRLVKPMLRWLSAVNVLIYRWSDGHLGHRYGGGEVCIVSMTGAKSGRRLQVPLMYVPYGDGIVLVASMGGAPRHPTWYYNLRAHPEIEVTVAGRTMALLARQASSAEKALVWPLCCQHYRDFALYQRRSTRDIPVFICTPRDC